MTKGYLFVILFTLTSFLSISAQENDLLKNDLSQSFKNVNVIRMNTRDAVRQAKASQKISISTSNKTFELSLTPRDLRSSRYYAENVTAGGNERLEKAAVTTYKGKIDGDTQSEVRLTMDDSGIEGYFGSKQERFFIEPAKKYSNAAGTDEFVVYKAEDVLKDKNFTCPDDLTKEIEDGKQMVLTNGTQSLTGLKTIEMATDADYEFVNSTTNAAGANAKILSILNMVEGIYHSELNLTLSVVYQHTWSTQDTFETATPIFMPGRTCNPNLATSKVLCNFQDYWQANLPASQISRDTAHLFSYKASVRAQGLAYVSEICDPNFAYGISGRVDVSWGWEQANVMITAHEIGHNLGGHHTEDINAPADCLNTLMNAQLGGGTQSSFCTTSRNEIGNFVASNGTCLTARNFGWFDFDGDGKTDVAIFRPSVGEWWINRSSTGQTVAAQFGSGSDKVTIGDFTGDGKTDMAFWRPSDGNWYILRSEDGSFFSFPFGANGDIPIPADYDGDGLTDPAVFRPSAGTWYISQSSGGTNIAQFGTNGDVPVTSDYDGDGKADIAIFRPSVGEWWINRSALGVRAFQFGNSSDKPVQGDYTGDGKADVGIFRPSNGNWYILRSEDGSFFSFPFGTNGDVPAPGDYDGDGKFDPAVFRPAAGTWYINRTTAGTAIVTFGANGDKPVPSAYIP